MNKTTLLNVDCMDYMAEQPDKSFDLAIVDPPYGIGTGILKNNQSRGKLAKAKNYKGYKNEKKDRPSKLYFSELKRISTNQIIWGANHLADLFMAMGPAWIVWDKDNFGIDFADCELAYSSFKCTLRKFKFRWNGMMQQDMANKEIRIHISQKPVALYRWLLENYAKPGQRIIDTHLGSGSSAIAAHYFGCDFVGMEIDKDYSDAAKKRFNKETRQLAMTFQRKEYVNV